MNNNNIGIKNIASIGKILSINFSFTLSSVEIFFFFLSIVIKYERNYITLQELTKVTRYILTLDQIKYATS